MPEWLKSARRKGNARVVIWMARGIGNVRADDFRAQPKSIPTNLQMNLSLRNVLDLELENSIQNAWASQVSTKKRDLVSDRKYFCWIINVKAGWLVGM